MQALLLLYALFYAIPPSPMLFLVWSYQFSGEEGSIYITLSSTFHLPRENNGINCPAL